MRWARSGSYRKPGSQRLQLINVPGTAERAVLKARWVELRDHLHSLNKQIVVASLIELLGCYPNAQRGDPRNIAWKYLRELGGLPTWAIVRACEQIRSGGFEEHKTYPPSTMALRQIVRDYCELPLREMHEITEVMQGEVSEKAISPLERDRVQSLLRGLGDVLRAGGRSEPIGAAELNQRPPRWRGEVSAELASIIRQTKKEAL